MSCAWPARPARKRVLFYVAVALMRLACGGGDARRRALGKASALERLLRVVDACGARELELVEACVSALAALLACGPNRSRVSRGAFAAPARLVALLQAADDPRLAHLKAQGVMLLWQLALCAEARGALLALRATAVLHRLLHWGCEGADADALRASSA